MPTKKGEDQYKGLTGHYRKKYVGVEYKTFPTGKVRKLTTKELREWHARLSGVVQLNTQRRAVV